MAKQRPRLDSARREGLETTFHEISDCSGDASTGGEVWAEFAKSESRDVFACRATIGDAMAKWRPWLDSARHTGLKRI